MEQNEIVACNNIVENLANTIVDYNVDTVIDLTEIGIDNIFEDSVLKEIPIVKTMYSIAKTGFAIRERHMLKKTLVFLEQLNSNNISNENYIKYKEKLRNKEKAKLKELEHVLIIIDRYVEQNKSRILANLYWNYIDKKIDWDQFQELSIIVDNIYLGDFKELESIYKRREITMNEINNKVSFRRLKNLNIVEDIETTLRLPEGGIGHFYSDYDYQITSLGIMLYECGLTNPLIINNDVYGC